VIELSNNTLTSLPVLPLRDVVIFPYMVIPLFVGRVNSTNAVESAMKNNHEIFVVAQKDGAQESPTTDDLYAVGTIATVLQLLKLPDGTVKALVEGQQRARVKQYAFNDDCLYADLEVIHTSEVPDDEQQNIIRTLLRQFEELGRLNAKVPSEIFASLSSITDACRLVDSIIAHLHLKLTDKQKLLETESVLERISLLMSLIEAEIELIKVEEKIRRQVKKQMEKSQREYYLNEQMKAIQRELGDGDSSGSELDKLEQKIKAAGMSDEAQDKSLSELKRLRSMSPMSAEATVSRSYIDTMIDLPWQKKSKINYNLAKAEQVLNKDHYGLEEVKERVIEYLAVQQRTKRLKGPILCLVGPPGVGKTSLANSIAKATGRRYTRIALGGVRDEAEIRGHRRTYIGSMPGKIMQRLTKIQVNNPLFLLDEIDKMTTDFRGDPSSALLEVLDPEQNATFNDHYLDVDFDLSDIMFICTANSLNIPGPLLDRMEVIRIPGYTEMEKIKIAENYLIPKQIEANGLRTKELSISTGAIQEIIRHYTREAGVRNLERQIAKVCRKIVTKILKAKKKKTTTSQLTARNLEKYLGVEKFRYGKADELNRIGQVTGLAWTEVGGELLTVEAAIFIGKGPMVSTGRLGEVMQESVKAALTVVKSRVASLGISDDYFENRQIHVHVPEGATPKDGPSAGIAMCTALVSTVMEIPVKAEVAMTGEITLRGEVLPIGGLKEKLLAAHRGGIKHVIIPHENKRDLKEIPQVILKDLSVHPVRWIDEVFDIALTAIPTSKVKHDVAVKQKKLAKA
jgi:ATP-dependent Lon protease